MRECAGELLKHGLSRARGGTEIIIMEARREEGDDRLIEPRRRHTTILGLVTRGPRPARSRDDKMPRVHAAALEQSPQSVRFFLAASAALLGQLQRFGLVERVRRHGSADADKVWIHALPFAGFKAAARVNAAFG